MTKESAIKRKPLVYKDFTLRFAYYNQQDGTFKVWVEGETPGGAMRPDDAVTRTYDAKAFWKDPVLGAGGVLGKLERRSLDKEDLFKLGLLLAHLALPHERIRPLFDKSVAALQVGEGLRVRLRLDAAELAQLPWEFMALPQVSGEPQDTDFLALHSNISIVRTDTVEAAARPLPNRSVALMVGVLAQPEDQPNLKLERDKAAVEQAVQVLNEVAGQELIQLTWAERPTTRAALQKVLAIGADIFQYAGHATFELNQEGRLILENEENESDLYPASQLAQILRSAGVRLVILNACETGRRNGRNVWTGVAPALTREKIPAVLANQFDILDINAILLGAKIYAHVLSGYTLDEALFEARQAIYQTEGLKGRDWGVPVLYLQDESGVLFPMPKRVEADKSVGQDPFIRVAQIIGEVDGEVTGVKIKKMTHGCVEVKTDVGVVYGKVTSVEINEMSNNLY